MPNPLNVPITPPRVAFIDSRTGTVSREWYMFFLSLFQLTGGSSASLDDLQKGPPTLTVDEISVIVDKPSENLRPSTESTIEQTAELQKQVQALEVATDPTALLAQIDELQKQVQALQLTPPPREFKRARYGSFYDTTTQTAAVINTAYGVTFNTTDLSNGVYIGSPTSRIYVDESSLYDFQFSAQFDNTSGGDQLAWIWLRKNGTNVADSAGEIRLKGNNSELVASWNYFIELVEGDYVEIMWSTDNTAVQITARPAAAPVPAIPSIILTVSNNIKGVQ